MVNPRPATDENPPLTSAPGGLGGGGAGSAWAGASQAPVISTVVEADELATRSKRLINEVGEGLAAFAKRADELDEMITRRNQTTRAALAKEKSDQESEAERLLAELKQRHQADAAAISQDFETSTSKIKREANAKASRVDEEASGAINAAKRGHDERAWMAETMYDSAKDRPRQLQELVRQELEPRLPQLAQLGQIAAASLVATGHGPLPEPSASALAEEPSVEIDDELPSPAAKGEKVAKLPPEVVAAVALFVEANERVQTLVNLKLPRLYAMPWPLVIAGAGALALGIPAWYLDAWAFSVKLWIGLGVGLVGALVLLYGLRGWSRARIAPHRQAAADAMAKAERTIRGVLERAQATRLAREKATRHRRDRELAQARTILETAHKAAKTARETEIERIKNEANSALREMTERREAATTELRARGEAELAAELTRATRARQELASRTAEAERSLAETEARERAALRADFEPWARRQEAGRDALRMEVDLASPPWSAGSVAMPRPRPPLRVGKAGLQLAGGPIDALARRGLVTDLGPVLEVPVALQTPLHASLLVQGPSDKRAEVVSVLQSAALRALLSLPPGKVRFVLVDPVGLGQSFAGMMHLADENPQFVTDRIWTEGRHIEMRLADLTEHMENVIQKYLRNDFATIDDYNTFAGEVAEPYRFLVVSDFPAGFSENAAAKLASIVQSGPRCGVYTLIGMDPRAKLPGGSSVAGQPPLSVADLERAALTLRYQQGKFGVKDDVLGKLDFAPTPPPPDEEQKPLVQKAGAIAKEAARVQVGFGLLLPAGGLEWTGDTGRELRIPLGRFGANKLQYMTLGRGTAQHVLCAGRTGSGKSTLLNVVITAASAWFSPDQLELYLIDFKKGVEFRAYAAERLPHARVIAIESEREFGLSVLRKLDEELARRGQLFREVGAQDLAAFRAARPDEAMPRCLLMIDEFQEFFSEDDKLASEAGLLLDRLVRQGRAFGMHVILGSQTLAGAYSLARATIGQMAVRIALQCSEADSYLILSEDNAAARLLSRPGEAIYNDASGMLEGNSPFQVAWLPDEERSERLGRVRGLLANHTLKRRPTPAVVFEGNKPGRIEDNALLGELLAVPRKTDVSSARVWLGEPVSIKDPTGFSFQRQSANNLMLVSQREDQATGMLGAAIKALLVQHGPLARAADGPARITVLDGTPADSPLAGELAKAAESVASRAGEAKAATYREVESVLGGLHAELLRRQEADATDAPALFLVIAQLQRYRNLRRGEDDFGYSMGEEAKALSPDKMLLALLREGPALGIFTLIWCDTAANVERTLPRNALKEFDYRVLSQMSAADSSAMIDAPSASNLGPSRAVLFTESQGTMERFRPYSAGRGD